MRYSKTVMPDSYDFQGSLEASYLIAAVTYHARYALIMTVTVIVGRSCIESKNALTDASCRVDLDLNHHEGLSMTITLEVGEVLAEP